MGLNRNVSLEAGLGYKGGGPYWTYILHRIGGSALFIFFTIYILALVGVQAATGILSNWVFQLIFLPFMLFHAINGLRITIVDLFPRLLPHEREAIWVEWAVFLPLYAIAVFVIIRTAGG